MYFYQNGEMISRERVKSVENQQRGLSVIVFYQIELMLDRIEHHHDRI